MIRLLVADDHQMFREGICKLLSSTKGMRVIKESHSGSEAVNFIKSNHDEIDIALLDISMPEMDGIEASKLIKSIAPKSKIILLSMHNNGRIIETASKIGVDAFVAKDACHEQLIEVISTVHNNNNNSFIYRSNKGPNRDSSLHQNYSSKHVQGVLELTKKEKAIVRLICKEHTTKEIADALHVSVNTIETHRRNIFSKTGCKNVVGLVNFAHAAGLV